MDSLLKTSILDEDIVSATLPPIIMEGLQMGPSNMIVTFQIPSFSTAMIMGERVKKPSFSRKSFGVPF